MSEEASIDPAHRTPALIDTRIIEFGQAAIRAALESVGTKILGLPSGSRVERFTLDSTMNAIRAVYHKDPRQQFLQSGQLAAMMIAYCIAARIPISRTANKSIAVTETAISMRFVTMVATAPRA